MEKDVSMRLGSEPTHDVELVRKARRGDSAAIEAVLQRLACVRTMLRACHRRHGSTLPPDELAEVEQEVHAALWAKLDGFEGRAALETWAYRFVALELLKAFERRARRRRATADDARLASVPAHESEELSVDAAVLHEALDRVGGPSADVIRQRHFEALAFDEIAARSGEPESTIKARYYRGLKRLREVLVPYLRNDRR
jgi:RNA polymerase sigma-70 factor (ECF subfamily)